MTTTLRIYAACLASYNSGVLHGRWIDVSDPDTMRSEIAEMLRESKFPNVEVTCPACDGADATCETCGGRGRVASAEEWACHDFECDGLKLSEYPDLEELCKLAEGVEEHGQAFVAWVNNAPGDNTDVSDFEDHYRGSYKDLGEYAAEYWEEVSDIKAPDGQWWHPLNYTDWDRMGSDLETSGDIWTAENPEGGVFIFNS